MEGSGGGGDVAEGAGAGFEWDADSQLYYHSSTGFYHDPVAGWYYSSRDGQYYIYENGNYVQLTTDLGNEPTANYPHDEANQDVLESSYWQPAIPDGENETLGPPSEWMEETLINLYLSGYSNREVNAESSLGNTHTIEEDRTETAVNKPSSLTSDGASASLNDATSQHVEVETETKNSTAVDESLGEDEEKWLAQYGQVERVNDDLPLLPITDIWDWYVVQDNVSNVKPVVRLVGCLSRGSSKLHPSLPAHGGRLRTASVSEVHLDLVRVSTGKLYRLRNPSRKYLASLSAYDSSNPTKDWGFPDIYANPDINLNKQSTAQCESEVADESSVREGVSADNDKEQKTNTYRDRAAERRNLHRGLGIGPGQKQCNIISFDEYEESIDDINSMGTASVDMNFRSSGLQSAKRIMENMGWKEGEALGKSRKGIVEPIQPIINKHGAGLGWNQTR
ncbi:RNA-binding protein 5 isoform X2 [Setaria italica]|uniref:RNA-binding protein 5 isoform X2 n=1 Tax=Setaria italica TaxID=4555 RepID=UPI000BE5BB8C|nr:RNA-binding protein 5 isoform X2 [Setaria italica]